MISKLIASATKPIINSWIVILVSLVSIIFFPIIAVAHLNSRFGQLWYGVIFSIGHFIYLTKASDGLKRKMFSSLESDYKRNSRVLEIGPGIGANFAYYPDNFRLSTLEANFLLQREAETIKLKYPKIVIEKMLIGCSAENMTDHIHDNSYDIVIASHVLCCVKDRNAAAREIYRILRRGGKFYCLENTSWDSSSNANRIKRLIVKLVSIFWSYALLGCQTGNIDVHDILTKAGFDTSKMVLNYDPDAPISHQLTLYGSALKK